MTFTMNRRPAAVVSLLVALLFGGVFAPWIAGAVTGASSEPGAVATRFFEEVYTEGNLDAAAELVAPGAAIHTPDGTMRGPTGVAGLVAGLRSAFPDADFAITQTIVVDDSVLVHWSMKGTHWGDFLGNAPTGTRVVMDGIALLTVQEGRIVEEWVQYDRLGVLRQIEGSWSHAPDALPCRACGPTA